MRKKSKSIYIALGANLSNPKETFCVALDALCMRGFDVLHVSGLWQSPAWPPGSLQPDYINACAEVDYTGSAPECLGVLHDVEAEFGRVRTERNAPRILDLDLLDFRGQVIDARDIQLPHPRMLGRGFVLFPLSEIAPDWRDPLMARALIDHMARLPLKEVQDMRWLGHFRR